MTEQSAREAEVRCARCGEAATGRFCSNCGAPVQDASCDACGARLQAGARFCNNCGAPAGGVASGVGRQRQRETNVAKLVGGASVLTLLAFVAGALAGRQSGDAESRPQLGGIASSPSSAPDISNMSPEERASRLFNRVMAYREQGKIDSARFFAPMAIQAYQMIGPLDLHARYDVGAISAAVGETAMARVEADSILATQPDNLLGLVLAIRAAGMAGDTKGVARLEQRLVAAAPAERAKGLKEYDEHGRDIDEALKKAGAAPAP